MAAVYSSRCSTPNAASSQGVLIRSKKRIKLPWKIRTVREAHLPDFGNMRIHEIHIKGFRGIKTADFVLGNHTLLVGENDVGKTTILEAINLTLGPDRGGRPDSIDEHDFFLGNYELTAAESANERADSGDEQKWPEIRIDITLDDLASTELSRFHAFLELWNGAQARPYTADEIEDRADAAPEHYVLRVTFRGWYDREDDEFKSETFFTKSEVTGTEPTSLNRRDKQRIGFLYLRGYRTATRAASLERGSLLDILLDIKKARPRVWGAILQQLHSLGSALETDEAFKKVLAHLEGKLDRYLPKRSGAPRRSALFVSDLTRRELRGVMTYFLNSPGQSHLVPLARLGSGTTNILVLALLTAIAETKENVIFGMEEPEIAIPPYTQRRILSELSALSSQTIVTSHSPYVAERFLNHDILVLRKSDGVVTGSSVTAAGLEPKRLRQDFRVRYAEGILSNAILLCEGISDRAVLMEINQKLASLPGTTYVDLDIVGVTVVPVGSDAGAILKVATFYRALNLAVFAVSDKVDDAASADIAAVVEWHENLPYKGLEKLLSSECDAGEITKFLQSARSEPSWPGNISLPLDGTGDQAWRDCFESVLKTRKGDEYAARFVSGLAAVYLPRSLVTVLARCAAGVQGARYKQTDPLFSLVGTTRPALFEAAAKSDG